MRTLRKVPRSLIVAGLMLVTGGALAALLRGGGSEPSGAAPVAAPGAAAPPAVEAEFPAPAPAAEAPATPLGPFDFDLERTRSQLDPAQAVVEDGRLVQHLVDGSTVVYALVPAVQESIRSLLEKYDVPIAAAVAIDVATGKVVAYVSRSRGPVERDPCLDASAPAASVFKVVTSAALLEEAGVSVDTEVCYRNGSGLRRIGLKDLDEVVEAGADGVTCSTLSDGLAKSINPVFARLGDTKLSARVLLRYAEKFVFGRALPFDLPLDVSPVEVPQDRLEFARTASGFWHVGLSPVHAAVLAQTVAADGQMRRPTLIDVVLAPDGTEVYRAQPEPLRRVVRPETAQALTRMMIATVDSGTGRREFVDPQGRPFLSVPVAGKTGSLNNPNPFMAYTWFVGFAPAGQAPTPEQPVYAVAALVVNEERWRIKAPLLAREVLRGLLNP